MSQLLLLHYIEVSLLECLLKGEEIIKCHNDIIIIILRSSLATNQAMALLTKSYQLFY